MLGANFGRNTLVAHNLLHEGGNEKAATAEAHLARWLGGKEEFLKV